MHLGSTERLVVAVLTGRHLDQRGTPEEDLGALLDHDDVVAHARDVGATRGAVAEHQRDRGDPCGAELREVAEHPTAGDEDLGLRRQIGAAGLDEGDERQPVFAGDLHGPAGLLRRHRVGRAAAHGGVVGDEHALDALDDADSGDGARPDREAAAVRRQGRQLEERAVAVDQQLDPLARQQLASGAVALHVLGPASAARGVEVGVEVGQQREHRLAVGGGLGSAPVEPVGEHGHGAPLPGRVNGG